MNDDIVQVVGRTVKVAGLSGGLAGGNAKLVAVREAALQRELQAVEQRVKDDRIGPAGVAEAALQTRLESFTEAVINIVIGFFINFWGNWFILPLVGFTTLTVKDNFTIGLLFTIISVARQYAIRRWAQKSLRQAKVVTAKYIGDLWNKFLAA